MNVIPMTSYRVAHPGAHRQCAVCETVSVSVSGLINQLLIDSNGITPLEITSLIC